MIRTMDGVVRAGGRRMVVGQPARRPVREPAVLDLRGPMSGVRTMDGVMRRPSPSPLEVINNTFAAPAAVADRRAAWDGWTELDWPYAIAFSLVVPVMMAASVMSTARLRAGAAAIVPVAHNDVPTTLVADVPAAEAPAAVVTAPGAAPAVAAATTAPPPSVPIIADPRPIATIISSFIASHGSKYYVVVKDLNTGEAYGQGAEVSMTSASLYKLFVAKTIYQMIDSGKLDYGSQLSNGQTVSGCLYNMITWSDNNCGVTLGTLVGWGRQNGQLRTEGFGGTNLATPQQTSAQDVATLFERLYNGTLLSPASTQNFLDLLKAQRVNNRLPLGLPAGTTIAHKTGDLYGYLHDAGIVYGPKSTYLIVVMGAPGSNAAAFGELSSQIYGHFNL